MSARGNSGDRLGAIAAAVTTLAMIATPLARPRGTTRRVLSTVVVTSMAVTTTARCARRFGPRRTVAAATSIAVGTAAVERIGTATGLPFGRYEYTDALRPQVAGVPVIVPLAWLAMAVPAHQSAHAALGRRSTRAGRIVLGAAALTAWDLFLDPQMVGEGYWRWARVGRYRGIPLGNFVGWFVTGLGVMTLIEFVLQPDAAADPGLVAEYAVMGALETVGFAAFFRDRTVAVVGGLAMLPIAAAAVAQLVGQSRWKVAR